LKEQINMKNSKFANLPRYENGRLKDLPSIFHELTATQVLNLHEDDWSYYGELQEECRIMFAEEIAYLKKEMAA